MWDRRSPAMIAVVIAAASAGLRADVEITGTFDHKERMFIWWVTNHTSSTIVYVEFPHFHADAFLPPKGWAEQSTNLVHAQIPLEEGVVTATASSPAVGIRPGKKEAFVMRQSLAEAQFGKGMATIRFEDGRVQKIDGVPVSEKPKQQGFGPAPAIAIGVIFVAYVLIRSRRGRRSSTIAGPPTQRDDVI